MLKLLLLASWLCSSYYSDDNRNFCKLMNCLINNAAQGKTTKQLSSTDISTIREVVDAKLPISARAELVITEATGELFEHHLKKERKTRNAQKIQNTEPLAENITEAVQTEIIKVYPNPNDGSMQVQYSLAEGESGRFIIYDAMGRVLNSYNLQSGSKELRVSEASLKNGIYFYQFISDSRTITGKIVIVK